MATPARPQAGEQMIRCVILDDYQNVALRMADWSGLQGRVDIAALNEHVSDREELVARLADAEIVVAMRERTAFDHALLNRLPKLELLITTGMVNASIDIAAANARSVTVCGTESIAGSTAELTWGLLLSLLRHIPEEFAGMRRGGPWQQTVGRDLQGTTMGIAGLGRLGSRVARVAQAFEMNVAAWSRSLTEDRARELGITRCTTLHDLLRISDVVSVHLKLTAETTGLIGKAELDLMKPDAILINTSRGPIVQEAALLAALSEGRIRAGLDVYDKEPLPLDHPLRTIPNVVTTPHLGYVTDDTYRTYFRGVVEDIEAWLAGAPVRVIAPPGEGPGTSSRF